MTVCPFCLGTGTRLLPGPTDPAPIEVECDHQPVPFGGLTSWPASDPPSREVTA